MSATNNSKKLNSNNSMLHHQFLIVIFFLCCMCVNLPTPLYEQGVTQGQLSWVQQVWIEFSFS